MSKKLGEGTDLEKERELAMEVLRKAKGKKLGKIKLASLESSIKVAQQYGETMRGRLIEQALVNDGIEFVWHGATPGLDAEFEPGKAWLELL